MNNKWNNHVFIGSLYGILSLCMLFLTSLFLSLWIPIGSFRNFCNIDLVMIWNPLFRSLLTSMISTWICIVTGLLAGYCAYRLIPSNKVVHLMMRSFVAVPPVVVGLALLILLGDSFFGKWLNDRGFQFAFDTKGVVLAQVAINLPLSIVYMMDIFDKIESRLLSVAETCGATELMLFTRIAIPLSKKHIISTGMILWSKAMGQFGAVVMIAGVVRNKTLVLPSAIYLYFSTGEIEKGVFIAIILFVVAVFIQSIAYVFSYYFD